jgi:hypothetical protein
MFFEHGWKIESKIKGLDGILHSEIDLFWKAYMFKKYIQNQDKIQHKQKLKKQKTSIEVDGMI